MVLRTLNAARGALAFLSRLPVGGDEDEVAWEAFRRAPSAFVLAGYVLGALLALPFVLPFPAHARAALYLVAVYAVTGVTHADGLADLGDAAAVHGDSTARGATLARREALKDASLGAGGVLALSLSVAALALGALALAGAPVLVAVGVVVAGEVGAKAGMAVLVCLGEPAHGGLGEALLSESSSTDLGGVALALVALVFGTLAVVVLAAAVDSGVEPFALVAGAGGLAPGAAVLAAAAAGPAGALLVGRWARRNLGGVSGDVLGATNELGRLAGLHAGVIAWTLS